MSYQMRRVFCAAAADLEDERQAFHDLVGQVNESEGLAKRVLLVPVSLLPNMADKTFFQTVVDQNVRDSRFFVLMLGDTWGPPQRNFEREFRMATELLAEPEAEMEGIAVFLKAGGKLSLEIAGF